MNVSILIFFGTVLIVECRKCFNPISNSLISNDAYGKCPVNVPKCCGTKRDRCATSCVDFKCNTNEHCDGLTCCSGHCSDNKNCLPVTTWGVVGIAVVSLFIVLTLFRACQWCRKRKLWARQDTRTTSEEQTNNEPPFVVSDFDNHGFITPMAPPAYESVVQNTGSRTDGNPPVYNLNLQTLINNPSTNDPGSNNFEVNISIRGSTMFHSDFPPSYSEISNSSYDDGQPPFYNSSQGVENIEERRLTPSSYTDEPPPYSLNEESPTDPGNITTDPSIDQGSTLSQNNIFSGEIQIVTGSNLEIDNEQTSPRSSNVSEISPRLTRSESTTHEISNEEQSCYNVNQDEDIASSSLSSNSSWSNSTVSVTATTEATTYF